MAHGCMVFIRGAQYVDRPVDNKTQLGGHPLAMLHRIENMNRPATIKMFWLDFWSAAMLVLYRMFRGQSREGKQYSVC